MDFKAISKTILIIIVAVIIIVGAVAAFFLLQQPTEVQVAGTINLYIGIGEDGIAEGPEATLYIIVTPANQTFKVGDNIKVVFNNNNTYPPDEHIFRISDPDGAKVADIGAKPGETKEIIITLEKAGEYKLTCLTFCGAWHTFPGKMVNVLLVKAES